jgi:hypothetical protein
LLRRVLQAPQASQPMVQASHALQASQLRSQASWALQELQTV